MMRRALRKLLKGTVTHQPRIGADKQGKPDFGEAVSCRARIDENRVVRRGDGGQQFLLAGPTFIADVAVTEQDKITFADGSERYVFASDVIREPDGTLSHSEVYFA